MIPSTIHRYVFWIAIEIFFEKAHAIRKKIAAGATWGLVG